MQQICVLGSTGSIGISTLDVLASHPDKFSVYALTANSSIDLLVEQCLKFSPQYAVIRDEALYLPLKQRIESLNCTTEVLAGEQALCDVASAGQVDSVMAAIVGAAGLAPTLAAVEAGKRVLLANKESLVMSGKLFMQAAKAASALVLPIDSEHNAIFQCLPQPYTSLVDAGVQKILLTGSGGPFRDTPLADLSAKTPDQACAHPNWSMGRKISVDSATMMNKGLEFIEACWLFDATPEQIEIVVHPQSIIHSMVQYVDGSVLAQMGNPDMRTPIAHCLDWPRRIDSGVAPLDFFALQGLDFCRPDYQRFPALALATSAIKSGGTYPVALNAANEVAVALFLEEKIKFTDIAAIIAAVLEDWETCEPDTIAAVKEADAIARKLAYSVAAKFGY